MTFGGRGRQSRKRARKFEAYPKACGTPRTFVGTNPTFLLFVVRSTSFKRPVSRVTVAEIETGRKQGSVATLRKLADALGIGPDDLTA